MGRRRRIILIFPVLRSFRGTNVFVLRLITNARFLCVVIADTNVINDLKEIRWLSRRQRHHMPFLSFWFCILIGHILIVARTRANERKRNGGKLANSESYARYRIRRSENE